MLRIARWAWPLVFLVPLTWFADRGCRFPGVDFAYHAMVWLHENLPLLYLSFGLLAAAAVTVRIARLRARAAALFSLSAPMPQALAVAFADEAQRLEITLPRIAYLEVSTPVCFALLGPQPAIVVSRGFVADLDPPRLRLIARHELLHIKNQDPLRGFAWHLTFAALLLPAFDALEAWLTGRRELRTNLEAAEDDPETYAELLRSRASGRRNLCVDGFGMSPRSRTLRRALIAPIFVVAVLAALAVSHAWFLEHLAYLTAHHC